MTRRETIYTTGHGDIAEAVRDSAKMRTGLTLIKRIISYIFTLLIPLILLAGCFLYDEQVGDNIGSFIDPINNPNGDFLPEQNANKTYELLPLENEPDIPEDDEEDDDDGIVIIDENHVRLTKPPVIETSENNMTVYYYEGDSFRFTVPFIWRNTMIVDVVTETDEDGYEISYYIFYYVPEDQMFYPPQQAKVMDIRVVPYDYFLRHGHGSDGVAATEEVKKSDGYVYTLLLPSEDYQLSTDFPDINGYINIQMVLSANWNFQHVDRETMGGG